MAAPNPKLLTKTLPNGMKVWYHSATSLDLVYRELFSEHAYDKLPFEVRNGDCIFDVGANIGFFVLFLSQHIQNATVFALEPIPENFEAAQRNIEQNCRLQTHLLNCGLGRQAGEVTFTHYPMTTVASTMYPQDSPEFRRSSRRFALGEMRERHPLLKFAIDHTPEWLWWPITETIRRIVQRKVLVKCQLRTLGDVIQEYGVTKIDLLKIDTEGAEEEILEGISAEDWGKVKQVMVEVHHGLEGLAKCRKMLEDAGFEVVTSQPYPGVDHLYLALARRPPHQPT